MYSSKENVNILTSLMVAHGIRYAVCCPGSRNSAIVHNLNACPDIECYPVTDERSAGFYALGMSQCLQKPVAVCVTSGTALLNLAPAVAEAYYQHIPLVVISADRPQAWIDQLDGQTLPQPDAFGRFVRKAVSLPEPYDAESRWFCNRLVNEALIIRHAPVHINVPISEPLFDYTVSELPKERKIELIESDASTMTQSHVVRMFLHAKRPMLISGQPMNPHMDEAVCLIGDDERYVPDFVLYTGGSIVSKRLKHFLYKAKETWAVNSMGEVNDTFQNLTHVMQGDGEVIADLIRFNLEQQPHPFVQLWEELLEKVRLQTIAYEPDYSQMAVVKRFERRQKSEIRSQYHYANSTAIRLANIYAVSEDMVYCIIGDLSFFYDQNALWHQNLHGNLRILLLNNGKGGIFNMLKGLEQSPSRDQYVAAEHHTSAEGICMQNRVVYLKATNMEEMQQGLDTLIDMESDRPVLLEVFTDATEDERVFKDYYRRLKI